MSKYLDDLNLKIAENRAAVIMKEIDTAIYLLKHCDANDRHAIAGKIYAMKEELKPLKLMINESKWKKVIG